MKRCDVAISGEECEAAYVYRVRDEMARERMRELEAAIKLHQKLCWDTWPDRDAIVERDRALWSVLKGDEG